MQRYTLYSLSQSRVPLERCIRCRTRAGVSFGEPEYPRPYHNGTVASIRAAARWRSCQLRWRNARGLIANAWYAAMQRERVATYLASA